MFVDCGHHNLQTFKTDRVQIYQSLQTFKTDRAEIYHNLQTFKTDRDEKYLNLQTFKIYRAEKYHNLQTFKTYRAEKYHNLQTFKTARAEKNTKIYQHLILVELRNITIYKQLRLIGLRHSDKTCSQIEPFFLHTLVLKCNCRLHFCFRTTLIAVAGFLDAFQKVADMATGSRGTLLHNCFNRPLLSESGIVHSIIISLPFSI